MRPMFRKLLLTVCITAAAFLANAQNTKTPIDFNDDLVEITDSLYKIGQNWGKAFNEAYKTTGNYATLKTARERMLVFVEAKLKYVANLKDVNNSKPLRQAYIDFLNYEKRMITEAFVPFEVLTSASSKEEVQKRMEKLRELSSQEGAMLTKVNEAQYRYASENGFTIEGKE